MKTAKKLTAIGLVGALALAGGVAVAQNTAPQGQVQVPVAAACPWADRMNAQMARMQAMHQAIVNARTSAEYQRLMIAHRQLMHQSMGMMRHVPGGYMGAGMGMRAGMGAHACINQRLAMMELMMQLMLDNSQPPPASK